MGLRNADDPAKVRENRARAAAALGVAPERLLTARQVHGSRCAIVDAPFAPEAAPEADALVCARPGIAIGVLSADCAPVLLADPRSGRVAAIHAGWRGLLAGVIEATLEVFGKEGSRPGDLYAAIGPCIGPHSYEVGPEFVEAFLAHDPQAAAFFWLKDGQRPRFDLPGYARARLVAAGLPEAQVEALAYDTYRDEALFFSHRRNAHAGEPRFGVQLSAILLLPATKVAT
jgi:YfiH family protein